MIEKRITLELLDNGELHLTPREVAELQLPQHSCAIDVELEGDRFSVQWSSRARALQGDILCERLQDFGQQGGLLRLAHGDPYALAILPPGATTGFVLRPPPAPRATTTPAVSARRARLAQSAARRFSTDDEYDWGRRSVPTIGFHVEARRDLTEQLRSGGFDTEELVELRLRGEELATLDDFEELLAVDVSNVDRMPYQEAVARKVLSQMRGRAVFADEVGLGKTIEAGLAMKELTLRGLARRILILVPATLREQWKEEMSHKFELDFDIAYRGSDIGDQPMLISSLMLAARERGQLLARPWDLVIVDEAHRAAGAGATATRELIGGLSASARYMFMLTATPVQNDLKELYRLVQLLRPGTFTSMSDFRRRFMAGNDPRQPKDPANLRRLVADAMVRTTRAQAGVDRVIRRPIDVSVVLGTAEQELYVLCTQLLRSVMTGSQDTMRRRTLAQRLTASPYSMGTTALRMADHHPDPRVAGILREVGNRAMNITMSRREDVAVDLISDWRREHGRVLVFTQHTDTVVALLRRLDRAGLTAVAFHGSMSAGERSASIERFRAGSAAVMVSTDAGAEGQNLQFCNCVVNYDLPWNPMRIEQRIGRVDRLTQPRDEVFVANMYAQNTIDEQVYRLLAEKLRMFELLFGQVTTILGEIDDKRTATFETRVLDAFLAQDDRQMAKLLDALGTDLATARSRAGELIAADSAQSAWLASSADHRRGLTKAGASELRAASEQRTRQRQRRVQAWVRAVVAALGGKVVHDTGRDKGAFVTVKFPEELDAELGGRTLIHLAFDKDGLEHHPDAEICAVGTPVFDEILGLLRVRGDLSATVAEPPEPGPSPIEHSPDITLVSRRFVPSKGWSGRATFRVAIGESGGDERVITSTVTSPDGQRLQPRRPLSDGDPWPGGIPTPAAVVAQFESALTPDLEAMREAHGQTLATQRHADLERIIAGYEAQISEASFDERQRLERAMELERRRLTRTPEVHARAHLLALSFDTDDHRIEEQWRHRNGATARIDYEWSPRKKPVVQSVASGDPVRVAAMCSAGHWIDASESTRCHSCDEDRCPSCGVDGRFAQCPVCRRDTCGRCREEGAGACHECTDPERAPDLDTDSLVGWRLPLGINMLIGERCCSIRGGPWGAGQLVVPDVDVDDDNRVAARAYAVAQGLPADAGVQLSEIQPSRSADADELVLQCTTAVTTEFETIERGGSAVEKLAVTMLPPVIDEVDVISERGSGLAARLAALRRAVRPPAPPGIRLVRRPQLSEIVLDTHRLSRRTVRIADDGARTIAPEDGVLVSLDDSNANERVLATLRLDGWLVTIERCNDAVLVTAGIGTSSRQWLAAWSAESARAQLQWAQLLRKIGHPGGRVGQSNRPWTPTETSFAHPTECELENRDVRRIVDTVPVTRGMSVDPVDVDELAGLQIVEQAPSEIEMVPEGLALNLLHAAEQPFTHGLLHGCEVAETWRGHGTTVRHARVFEDGRLWPVLDDTEQPAADFGVCRDGHLYEPGTAGECAACQEWACRSCDPQRTAALIDCHRCGQPACHRCAAGQHDVPKLRCEACSDVACGECGRDPSVAPCPVCQRLVCEGCRASGSTCRACAKLRRLSPGQVALLPDVVAARGAAVWRGSDGIADVLVIATTRRLESAVLTGQAIHHWYSYRPSSSLDHLTLELAASASLGYQATCVPKSTEQVDNVRSALRVRYAKRFRATWRCPLLDREGHSPTTHATPTGEQLHLDVLDLFGRASADLPEQRAPSEAIERFAIDELPEALVLEISWVEVIDEVALVAGGLVHRQRDVDERSDDLEEWAMPDLSPPTWVTRRWGQLSHVVAGVAVADTEATLISIADLHIVGVFDGVGAHWFALNNHLDAVGASWLASQHQLPAVHRIGRWTDPAAILITDLRNATTVAHHVRPTFRLSYDTPGGPGTTTEALRAWLPTADAPSTTALLPFEPLRSELNYRFPPSASPSLEIGSAITRVIGLAGGGSATYEITLEPGSTDARQRDIVSGRLLDEGWIDREEHLVALPIECPYCHGATCAICDGRLVPCGVCTQAICRRCAVSKGELLVCPACTSLHRANRKEAREAGRLLIGRGLLAGEDAVHRVVLEHHDKQWTLRGSGEGRIPVDPIARTYLDGLR